jgi:hypothetical protein
MVEETQLADVSEPSVFQVSVHFVDDFVGEVGEGEEVCAVAGGDPVVVSISDVGWGRGRYQIQAPE